MTRARQGALAYTRFLILLVLVVGVNLVALLILCLFEAAVGAMIAASIFVC